MAEFKVIVVVFVFISVCASRDLDEIFSEHAERVSIRNYPCGDPQPRVMYLREIIGDDLWLEKYKKDMRDIRPYATVLHRCEGSGCCTKYNQRCTAKHEQPVKLAFLIVSQQRYVEFTGMNHTQCGCQVISDDRIK